MKRVKLDIGGTIFSTSIENMTRIKGTYFESMFSGRWSLKPDESGAYFIDRDPYVFHFILNYLR